MAKGNSRHLSRAVCAGLLLGVGFMAAACGGDGSTTPSTLGYSKYGPVTFTYEQPETLLDRAVKYSFYNAAGECLMATDFLPLAESQLTVANVPDEATVVNGYFYATSSEGLPTEVVNFSVNTLDWQGTEGVSASVAQADPTLAPSDIFYVRIAPGVSHLDIGEETEVRLLGTYQLSADETTELDLTPLATIERTGHMCMLPRSSTLKNTFVGQTYGQQNFQAAFLHPWNTAQPAIESFPVYVSDAVLTGLVLQDKLTGAQDKLTVIHPSVDLGQTQMSFDGTTYNVGTGQIVALGQFESDNPLAPDFTVQLRDGEVVWSTPNNPQVGFNLDLDRATYTTRGAFQNAVLSAYALDPNQQRIEASLSLSAEVAQAHATQSVEPLVIGEKDYAQVNELPMGAHELLFKMEAYYEYRTQKSTVFAILPTMGSNVAEVYFSNLVPLERSPIFEARDGGIYAVSAGTTQAGDTGTIAVRLVDSEGKALVTAENPYNYTVVADPSATPEPPPEPLPTLPPQPPII